jgi:SAM-dependent methyltransferase
MIGRFFGAVRELVEPLMADSLLDAGCGEGEALIRLGDLLPSRVAAIDVSPASVELTRQRCPDVEVRLGSVYSLEAGSDAHDLILCLEVLEHLEDPRRALAELGRVAASDLILSVPFEPYFRIGSLMRGRYLRRLGDHPEHVNHFNRSTFAALLASELQVRSVGVAFPWLLAHCQPN